MSEVTGEIICEVIFTSQGVDIRTTAGREIKRIAVEDANGVILVDTGPIQASLAEYSLVLDWEESREYAFNVETASNGDISLSRTSPLRRSFRPRLELLLPYTEASEIIQEATNAVYDAGIIPGVTTSLALIARNPADAPLNGNVKLTLPNELLSPDAMMGASVAYEIHLSRYGETWLEQIPLLPQPGAAGPWDIYAAVEWEQAGEVWQDRQRMQVRLEEPREFRKYLSLGAIRFPCDSFGRPQRERRPDAFVLPAVSLYRIRSALGLGGAVSNRWTPMGFENVELANAGPSAAALVVEIQIVDPVTGKPVREMSAPDLLSGGKGASLGFVSIPPGSSKRINIPHYIDVKRVLSGSYERRIRVKPWGTDISLLETARPLEIVRPSHAAMLVVLYAVLGAILLAAAVLIRGNAFLARFQTRELVITALFATVLFSAVTLPMSILANFVTAILGPFAFLVTGIVNETAYYAILIAYLTLVPRVGALTALTSVRLLLSTILLGQITAPGLLYAASHIILMEAACYLSGLTGRFNRSGVRQSTMQALSRGEKVNLWWPAVCIGAADALSSWIDFQLTIELYRLYFAAWYIALTVVVHGFVYTLAGVHLGSRLGRSLGRTAP